MADDLIEKLRFCANLHPQFGYPENGKLFGAAADRITALQAQNRKLVDALRSVDEMFSRPGTINKTAVRDQVRAAIAEATKGST